MKLFKRMKTLKFYLLALISCMCMNVASAQEKAACRWAFFSAAPESFDDAVVQSAEQDKLGLRVACLKVLMEKSYVYREEIVPGDPTMRTIIRKPDIYNTVHKVEKHLKKEVKKGSITRQEATSDLVHVLEVAIAVIYEGDTEGFESSVRELKSNADEQIALFRQVRLDRFY
jgi:hypothetical protein